MKGITLFVGLLLMICQLTSAQIDTANNHLQSGDMSKKDPQKTISLQKKDSLQAKQMILVKLLNGNSFEGEFISANDSTATYQSNLGFITTNKSMIYSVQPINNISPSKTKETSPARVGLKVCADLAGSQKASAMGQSGSVDVKAGLSFALEFGKINDNVFNYAFGIMYLSPRELDVSGGGKFNFVPLYAVAKIKLTRQEEEIIPIIIANIGYDLIFNGDSDYNGPYSLSGGLYIAGGLRLEINKFFFEGLYKSFGGSASGNNINISVTYTTFSVAFGILL
jgi:hypothetical protein